MYIRMYVFTHIQNIYCTYVSISISYVPSTRGCTADGRPRKLIESVTVLLHIPCGRDITSLCHGMAILLLLHCSLSLMLLVTGNWFDRGKGDASLMT